MRYLLLILFPILIFAQPKESKLDKLAKQFTKHSSSNPDSAKYYLKLIEANTDKLNDSLVAKLYNSKAIYYFHQTKYDSAKYYINKSIKVNNSSPKIRGNSYTIISNVHKHLSEFPEAENYTRKSIKEFKKANHTQGIGIANSQLGSLKAYQSQNDSAIHFLNKSIEIFKKGNHKENLAISYQHLANQYFKMENFDFAIELYDECLGKFKENSDYRNYYFTLINYGDCLTYMNKFDRAKKVLFEAIEGLKNFNNIESISLAHSKLGTIYYEEKNYTKALEHNSIAYNNLKNTNSFRIFRIGIEQIKILNKHNRFDEAIEIINFLQNHPKQEFFDFENQLFFETISQETYKAIGNKTLLIESLEKSLSLKDSIHENSNKIEITKIQNQHQIEIQSERNKTLTKQNQYLSEKVKVQNRNYILLCIAILSTILTAYIIISKYRLKQKIQNQKLKSYADQNEKMKEINKISIQEAEIERKEKELKEKELTSFALQLADLQEQINTIINNNELEKPEHIKKALNKVINQKDYWSEFSMKFKNAHPKFSENINKEFPQLTKNDIQFLSLIKLNLSNKEIAALLQISHESVITKKYRVKKKMNIEDDNIFSNIINNS